MKNRQRTHSHSQLWIAILIGGLSLTLAGCDSYSSLQPLYTEADLIFETSLLGVWHPKDSKETIEFARADEKPYGKFAYKVTMKGADEKADIRIARLLKVNDRMFLDIAPVESPNENLLPVHTFHFVPQITPKLRIAEIDLKWLVDFLAHNPAAIKHEKVDDRILLTAAPKELQEFFLAHLGENGAFDSFEELEKAPVY